MRAVALGAVERLKFAEALPDQYARLVVARRFRQDEVVERIASWSAQLKS